MTARFHDGRTGTTHLVSPFVFGRELRIVGGHDTTLAVWNLDRIAAAPEIDPDGMVTLTARDQPGVLLIGDTAVLETLRRAGLKLPAHRPWRRGHWIAVSAGLSASLIAGVLALIMLPGWLASTIPASWERRLGDPVEALMVASTTRCTGAEGQAALNRLADRLRTAGRIEMPVQLTVLDDRMVNAFTLPGGRVLVMRGLIAEVDDGAVLAGVIAHELGHVAHRDSTTLLLREMGLSLLLSSIGLGDAGGAAMAGASHLTALAYGRAAEAAADDTAIELLTAAGLRADGLSRFFAHLETSRGRSGSGGKDGLEKNPPDATAPPESRPNAALSWLSTHPPTDERRTKTARPETGEMPFTEAEWQAVRTMCGRK